MRHPCPPQEPKTPVMAEVSFSDTPASLWHASGRSDFSPPRAKRVGQPTSTPPHIGQLPPCTMSSADTSFISPSVQRPPLAVDGPVQVTISKKRNWDGRYAGEGRRAVVKYQVMSRLSRHVTIHYIPRY
ncbi:hypothetical protein BGW80DRAFT_290781 [Lactifluus volemus]|nr:hypothetical protein BGW80DRAFT_290781 [Lactifluus volemus]